MTKQVSSIMPMGCPVRYRLPRALQLLSTIIPEPRFLLRQNTKPGNRL